MNWLITSSVFRPAFAAVGQVKYAAAIAGLHRSPKPPWLTPFAPALCRPVGVSSWQANEEDAREGSAEFLPSQRPPPMPMLWYPLFRGFVSIALNRAVFA